MPLPMAMDSNRGFPSSIKEELENSTSSKPSLIHSEREPSQALVDCLDFSFFRKVYSAYNIIWQRVLKLPIFGDSHVSRDEFIRVLQTCKIIDDRASNIFCSFLLFSCTSHLKPSSDQRGQQQPLLLIDFRLFLKSVFMTLKRQYYPDLSERQDA